MQFLLTPIGAVNVLGMVGGKTELQNQGTLSSTTAGWAPIQSSHALGPI